MARSDLMALSRRLAHSASLALSVPLAHSPAVVLSGGMARSLWMILSNSMAHSFEMALSRVVVTNSRFAHFVWHSLRAWLTRHTWHSRFPRLLNPGSAAA